MDREFSGQTIIVTGATKGIGRAGNDDRLAGSGKGCRRLSGSPQAAEAMNLEWFMNQGHVALTARYA